ncbi:sirtuin 5, partial [Armillaria nabsnona]
GIPPFRGTGGVWEKYDLSTLATPQTFEDNLSLVWMFYLSRWLGTSSATPNAACLALATLVTQNIDGLCEKADVSPSFEMHRRLSDTRCTSCGQIASMPEILESCPALSSLTGEFSPETPSISKKDLPHCSICDGLLRPGVVWFEESPRHLREVWDAVDQADMCLVIGTSSTVQPATGFAYEVSHHGGKVAVFNLNRSEGDDQADFLFLGPCEETLPGILFSSSPL